MNQASSFPAAVYRDTVLTHIFADAKRMFLASMLEIDYAHLLMLAEQGIVSKEIAGLCFKALDTLDRTQILSANYDGTFEDLFFLVQRQLADLCGAENAGCIHTARSRNDIDMTMYRMVLRDRILQVLDATLALRSCLVETASEHRASLMPGYTHNQPAQPTTLGHYLMAVVETLERDSERMQAAFKRVNHSPLGACAITTTGFPINRQRTAELLGFSGLQTNSYGAIASVDYVAESCSAIAVMMLSLGRLAQDLLMWSTAEFGYLRLSNGYVQVSSIMPQKRNPVPLEHVRILASKAMSQSQAVLTSLHNTPFADMNDGEDPLQPLVELAFQDSLRALTLLSGIMCEATFNTRLMEERAQGHFLTVTELADTLVRETGISFCKAHGFVGSAVKAQVSGFNREQMVSSVLKALQQEGIAQPETATLLQSLDARYFVNVRGIQGGPAPDALAAEIDRARRQLEADRNLVVAERDRLSKASQSLHEQVREFCADEFREEQSSLTARGLMT